MEAIVQVFGRRNGAAELNNHGSRSMNGENLDAGCVFGVIRRDEAIRRSDALWRAERLRIGEI
jgi:hypothetical protein